jgi:hypothetical protein
MNRNRRHIPGWCKTQMYRAWILDRQWEEITEEELTEEELERIERSKAQHPSRASGLMSYETHETLKRTTGQGEINIRPEARYQLQ